MRPRVRRKLHVPSLDLEGKNLPAFCSEDEDEAREPCGSTLSHCNTVHLQNGKILTGVRSASQMMQRG